MIPARPEIPRFPPRAPPGPPRRPVPPQTRPKANDPGTPCPSATPKGFHPNARAPPSRPGPRPGPRRDWSAAGVKPRPFGVSYQSVG
jgi:periplasmic protein TonB